VTVIVGFLLALHVLGIVVLLLPDPRTPKPWGYPWGVIIWPVFVLFDVISITLHRRRTRRQLARLKRDVWGGR